MVEDEGRVPYTGSGQQDGNKPQPRAPAKSQTGGHSRNSSSDGSFVNVTPSRATSPYIDDFDLDGHEANQGRGFRQTMGRPKPGDSDDEK